MKPWTVTRDGKKGRLHFLDPPVNYLEDHPSEWVIMGYNVHVSWICKINCFPKENDLPNFKWIIFWCSFSGCDAWVQAKKRHPKIGQINITINSQWAWLSTTSIKHDKTENILLMCSLFQILFIAGFWMMVIDRYCMILYFWFSIKKQHAKAEISQLSMFAGGSMKPWNSSALPGGRSWSRCRWKGPLPPHLDESAGMMTTWNNSDIHWKIGCNIRLIHPWQWTAMGW